MSGTVIGPIMCAIGFLGISILCRLKSAEFETDSWESVSSLFMVMFVGSLFFIQ